jgi:hypothetical protein
MLYGSSNMILVLEVNRFALLEICMIWLSFVLNTVKWPSSRGGNLIGNVFSVY